MALDVGELVAHLKMDRSDFNRGAEESEGRFSRLGAALGTAAKRVGAAGAAAVIASGAVGLHTAARMEQAEIAFSTMLGSGEKAKVFLTDLSAFAAKTPFEFPELQTAASSLVSAGVEANKVIPIMTTLGDVTSGMGTGSEGVKRATIALQQMNAAGRITGEDLNQLRDAGIPVYDLLAAATGKSKEQVVALAQAGKLGKTELDAMMKALESGEGLEKFNNLMEAQSQSLNGMWSTLKDTFSVGMAQAIQPLIPLIKEGLGGAITFLTGNMPRLASGLATVAGVGKQAFDVLFRGDFTGGGPLSEDSKAVGVLFAVRDGLIQVSGIAKQAYGVLFKGDFTGGPLSEDSNAVDVLFRIREGLGAVKDAVADAFETRGGSIDFAAALDKGAQAAEDLWPAIVRTAGAVEGLEPVVDVTGAVFGFLADNIDTVIKYLPLLLAGFVAYKAAQAASNVVALASLPIQAATVVSNFAAASANRALASAIAQQTAIQNANAISTARGTVATVAGTVAHVAASAASKAMTAAQWLLNAALTANPIGLVVVAIALLVGALVVAYKNSETFRNIVDAAFKAVAAGATWLWEHIFRPYFGFIIGIYKAVWEAAQALARISGEAFGVLRTAATFLWDNVLRPYFGFIIDLWLRVAETIVKGAEAAFGWVPGLGGKLKAASRAVEQFRDDVNAAMDGVKKEFDIKVVLRTEGMRDAAAAARNAARGDGPGAGGPTLARVSQLIAGTGAYVTSTYRSPAQNRAIGGSPTSYHLDRHNPAVDIGGSTSVLNSVAAKLRAAGGWRELLWQVPGHFDHIHAADQGGIFQGPGYVWMGAGQETFASGLAAQKVADLPRDRTPAPVLGGVTYSGPVYVVDPDEFARKTVARQRDAAAVSGIAGIAVGV